MSDDDDDCPFDILDLPESANENDITQRWKKLMLKNHPDKTSDPNSDKIAQRLNDAKDRAITIFRQNKKSQNTTHFPRVWRPVLTSIQQTRVQLRQIPLPKFQLKPKCRPVSTDSQFAVSPQ